MEGVLNEQDEDDIGAPETSPQYSDDHLIQFDKALESSLTLLNNESEDPMVPNSNSCPSNSEEAVEPNVMEGNTTIDVSNMMYADLLQEGEGDDRAKGPVVEIQDNGSMLV